MPRPESLSPDEAAVYDWFAANGVNEWIPDANLLTVRLTDSQLTYTSFPWSGPRGWDFNNMALEANSWTEERTVPLVVLMPDRIREILASKGATVIGP